MGEDYVEFFIVPGYSDSINSLRRTIGTLIISSFFFSVYRDVAHNNEDIYPLTLVLLSSVRNVSESEKN